MEYQTLRFEQDGDVGTIFINRPKAMNALNSAFFDEMEAFLTEIDKGNVNISVLIITGEGKAFAAGADISEMVNMTQKQGETFSQKGQQVFNHFEKLETPVIAAINGFALGGGLELAMACDFRFASSKAKFGQPEVNLGLIPGYAGTQRLPRLVGLAEALYMLTTAEMIDSPEALRIGLIQKIYEPEELLDKVKETAQTIAAKGPKAVKKVKAVTRFGVRNDFMEGSEKESSEFGSLFENEGAEGMRAFLEKRKPNW
ncbi:MAG: enoyl-CoA hydratase/isomerase family protein [Bacteroidales bacterium]|nr:enoyl-CoA hydratase/isomerase family protein [Bacteroidales bacterium]